MYKFSMDLSVSYDTLSNKIIRNKNSSVPYKTTIICIVECEVIIDGYGLVMSRWIMSGWLMSKWIMSGLVMSGWIMSRWVMSGWIMSRWVMSRWIVSRWLKAGQAMSGNRNVCMFVNVCMHACMHACTHTYTHASDYLVFSVRLFIQRLH